MFLQATRTQASACGFGSTHWVTIRAAAANDTAARAAREDLCRTYWYPLYAYLRRLGHKDAEDITQDFLTHILQRSWLTRADESKGRFRAFLLSSLDNFVLDAVARRNAKRRAGRYHHVPLDTETTASRYLLDEAAITVPPTMVYELEWAYATVMAALIHLEEEYTADGKQAHYKLLKPYLQELGSAAAYQATATAMEITIENVQVRVHRLRQRYGALLREEVSRTVNTPKEVDDEVLHLREMLRLDLRGVA